MPDKDGDKETFVVFDETHIMSDDRNDVGEWIIEFSDDTTTIYAVLCADRSWGFTGGRDNAEVFATREIGERFLTNAFAGSHDGRVVEK